MRWMKALRMALRKTGAAQIFSAQRSFSFSGDSQYLLQYHAIKRGISPKLCALLTTLVINFLIIRKSVWI